jgi:hypothetical protein
MIASSRTLSPMTPARIPEEDLSGELRSLLSIPPESVADASRNCVRLYVRDLQTALRELIETGRGQPLQIVK